MLTGLLAVLLVAAGVYLSAVAWGARLPPFAAPADRLFLLIPAQLLTLSGVLFGLVALGFSLNQIYQLMSSVLTHGGP
jgi:hypothetical protein